MRSASSVDVAGNPALLRDLEGGAAEGSGAPAWSSAGLAAGVSAGARASRAGRPEGSTLGPSSSGAAVPPRVPTCCYGAAPATYGFDLAPERVAAPVRGYAGGAGATASTAKATASSTKATASSTKATASSTKATASTASKGELAFLDDQTLSIEDKLFQFMTLMTKKQDQALVDAMKSYSERKEAAKNAAESGGGGGLLGAVAGVVGGIGGAVASVAEGALKSVVGGPAAAVAEGLAGALGDLGGSVVKGFEALAKDLGGPLLAAAVTALGMPALAPVALSIGGTVGKALVDGIASALKPATGNVPKGAGDGSSTVRPGLTSGGTGAPITSPSQASGAAGSAKSPAAKASSAASPTGVGTASADDFDEKLEMLGLQRMVEKGNTMFAALSNALKAMHDTQLSIVSNIR